MQSRKIKMIILVSILTPSIVFAVDVEIEDTFGSLIAKQAKVLDAEMDAKIRETQSRGSAGLPVPQLSGFKQEYSASEPTVDAIWGMKGKEVAEMTYKGRTIPVSMQDPYISKIDGWKLESIRAYQVTLVKLAKKGNVLTRKVIMFDWGGGDHSSFPMGGQNTPDAMMVPKIINPIK